MQQFNLMTPENVSEKFSESHHCNNLKFANCGNSRTHLGKLQGSLDMFQFSCSRDLNVYHVHIHVMKLFITLVLSIFYKKFLYKPSTSHNLGYWTFGKFNQKLSHVLLQIAMLKLHLLASNILNESIYTLWGNFTVIGVFTTTKKIFI